MVHPVVVVFVVVVVVGVVVVRPCPLGTADTTGLLYPPHVLDDGDCAAIGGMKIG
jgi:hypothetical protein